MAAFLFFIPYKHLAVVLYVSAPILSARNIYACFNISSCTQKEHIFVPETPCTHRLNIHTGICTSRPSYQHPYVHGFLFVCTHMQTRASCNPVRTVCTHFPIWLVTSRLGRTGKSLTFFTVYYSFTVKGISTSIQ